MSRSTSLLSRIGIATQLLVGFLAISLIPCVILTFVTTQISRDALEDTVRERLLTLSSAKTIQLENFVHERRGDATILGRSPELAALVPQLRESLRANRADSPEYRQAAEKSRPVLANFAAVYGYPNIHVADFDGVLLLSLQTEFEPGTNFLASPIRETALGEAVLRTKTILDSALSDYQLYPGRSQPAAYIAAPIFRGAVAIGLVIFEFDNREVFRVFSDYNNLGQTGETQAATRSGDELTYVTPSRHDRNAAFHTHIRLGSPQGIAMQRAVQGQRGYGEVDDYRGVKVVAAWSYLPSFRWGLVVKQDRSEAYDLIDHQYLAMVVVLGACTLIVTLAALAIARRISRPIQDAAQVAERVAAGDLTARITTHATGEAGKLLQAVETMTQDLRALIGRIQKSSIALLSTATEIAATSREQEQTLISYGASTSEAAAAVKQISATGSELLRTMTEVNTVAGQTAAMANVGQEGLAGMDRAMRALAASTGSFGAKLSVISERAANINLAVTTITKVADQTNLLSINAAIEAEKAGEYGLGFLVVAREIRRLADQTAVATLDIERMVREMQTSVAAGVMEMDKFSDQVRQGVVEVGRISDQLGQIITAVNGLTGRFDQVTEGMRVQSQGAEQIRESVVQINEGASQTSISLREFNKATAYLREAVSGLKEEVSRFTLGDAPADPAASVSTSTPAPTPAR
jgi:methyl-accepting chemotaxis protein WspA